MFLESKNNIPGGQLIAFLMIGPVIAIVLFYAMALMIRTDGDGFAHRSVRPQIEFSMIRQDDNLQTRDRTRPEPPEDLQELPTPDTQVLQNESRPTQDLNFDRPRMNISTSDIGTGPAVASGGAVQASNDSAPTPLVRVEPQYPRQAAMRGQEGWVKLRFNITEIGDVDNVEILEAEPRRVFDAAARAAVLRWRYRPQKIDGRPTVRENVVVQLDFNLQN